MSGADSVSIDSDPEGPGIFSIGYKSSPVSFFYMEWCGNRQLLNQRFEFLILVKNKCGKLGFKSECYVYFKK